MDTIDPQLEERRVKAPDELANSDPFSPKKLVADGGLIGSAKGKIQILGDIYSTGETWDAEL
jgi:hypothetical protein